MNVVPDLLDALLVVADEALPALLAELADAQQPLRIEFGVLVVLDEIFALDAVAFGKTHQADFETDETPVDFVKLLDQRVDAALIERERLDVGDELFFQLLVTALLRRRERLVLELVLDVLVLQLAQPLVGVGDLVEGLDHLRLQFGFHRS